MSVSDCKHNTLIKIDRLPPVVAVCLDCGRQITWFDGATRMRLTVEDNSGLDLRRMADEALENAKGMTPHSDILKAKTTSFKVLDEDGEWRELVDDE